MRRGTRVASGYVDLTVDGDGINEDIVDAVDAAGPGVKEKGEEHGEDYGDAFGEGFASRLRGKFSARLDKVFKGRDLGGDAGDKAGETFVDRMTEKVRETGDKIGAELSDRLASNPEGVRRGIDRAFDDSMLDRIGDRVGSRIAVSISESIEREGSRIGDALDTVMSKAVSGNSGRNKKGAGDLVGRLFGAGSRNNALNLFGKAIGGVVTLVDKAAKGVAIFAEGFGALGQGAGIVARLGGGFGAVGTSLAPLLASLPALAIGFGAVLLVMSGLVSVGGALLAILTALTSTIASGLVGALAVAGPLLGALVVAGGLVTAAFTSMTEAQSKYLSDAFQPLKAEFTGIGQIIFKEFVKPLYNGQSAIQVWSANLQQALLPLGTLAQKSAGAFATAGNTITESLSGPGFQRFFASLNTELPTIIRRLSSALGGFLNGVAGTFAAIMPYVTQFARYLDRVGTSFSNFANSAKGQNAISDFVGRAIDSLKSLWGFLKEVGGLVSDIFFDPRSQAAGNSIFDSLTASVRRFRGWLEKQDLKKWFDDAIEFGRKAKKAFKEFVEVVTDLYDDGTLDAIGDSLSVVGDALKFFNDKVAPAAGYVKTFNDAIGDLISPLGNLMDALNGAADAWDRLTGAASKGVPSAPDAPRSPEEQSNDDDGGAVPMARMVSSMQKKVKKRGGGNAYNLAMGRGKGPDLDALIESGNNALNNTLVENGGYMQPPKSGGKKGGKDKTFEQAEWKNPYLAFAASIMAQAPRLADEIRKSFSDAKTLLNRAVEDSAASLKSLLKDSFDGYLAGINDAVTSTDSTSVISSLSSIVKQMSESAATAMATAMTDGTANIDAAKATRDQMIGSAESAVQSAAQRLAGAGSKKEAKAALADLKTARAALDLARQKGDALVREAEEAANRMIQNSASTQQRIDKANNILAQQAVLNLNNVNALVAGQGLANATLADFAEARKQVADKLAAATDALIDAISLRDNYQSAVADSIRSFGSLLSAQAKTIDGVQQALSATDITDNLSDRLTKIKTFQNNLRLLLANNLSDAAYKQLVDAGVETGSAYAEALLAGGSGSISEVNNLTDQINEAAEGLGSAASSQLYQAGVDAAQGLVDGLTSLSAELDSAAAQLGTAIANAIRRELGIASPSKVLIGDMDHVGDGAVIGLDNQRNKIGRAGARFGSRISDQIAVSPEVAAYAARQGVPATTGTGVSGNPEDSVRVLWTGNIVTPTEDPHAVATEVLDELTERLT